MADDTLVSSQISPALAVPRPGLRSLMKNWAGPLLIFAGWRVWLGLIAIYALSSLPTADRTPMQFYQPPQLNFWGDSLLGAWARWDSEWFLQIAQHGYRPGEGSTPYFPLYPLLVKVFAAGTDLFLVAGVVVSSLAGLAAFILLYELARRDFGERVGLLSVAGLACFPTSFFLAACYSEGLFLALTLGAFLAVRHYSKWALAGLLIGLAALTRNMGIALLLPLGWEWLRQHGDKLVTHSEVGKWQVRVQWRELDLGETLAFIGLPFVCFGGWLAFNAVNFGDPFSFVSAITAGWNRHTTWPWNTFLSIVDIFLNPSKAFGERIANLVDLPIWLMAVGLLLVSVYMAWRKRMSVSYVLYFALAVLVPMTGPDPDLPLESFPRYVLLAFPAFMVLGMAARRWKYFAWLFLPGSLLLLTILFARFTNWYWVA